MRPGFPASCRWLVLSGLLALGLAGCAERVSVPPPQIAKPVETPWTAAIGKLEIAGAQPCTAILVSPAVILTASHCLHQHAGATPPTKLQFLPNFGAKPDLPAVTGISLRAQGGAIQEGHLERPEQVAADWALVGVAPAVTGVAPIPIAQLSAAEIMARINRGDRLFTAGYGYGAMKVLKQHAKCGIVNPKDMTPIYETGMLITTCIIRIGDSGGPMILLDGAGKPQLVGVFTGFGMRKTLGLSYAVNSSRVAPYLGAGLVSFLELPPPTGEGSFP
jgi:V8-like Glu-specific endopeptidase